MSSHSVYRELDATGLFTRMDTKVDEDEHSIEMHLPFTAKIMEKLVWQEEPKIVLIIAYASVIKVPLK